MKFLTVEFQYQTRNNKNEQAHTNKAPYSCHCVGFSFTIYSHNKVRINSTIFHRRVKGNAVLLRVLVNAIIGDSLSDFEKATIRWGVVEIRRDGDELKIAFRLDSDSRVHENAIEAGN